MSNIDPGGLDFNREDFAEGIIKTASAWGGRQKENPKLTLAEETVKIHSEAPGPTRSGPCDNCDPGLPLRQRRGFPALLNRRGNRAVRAPFQFYSAAVINFRYGLSVSIKLR